MHLNINTNPISLAQLSNIWREDITVTIDALAKDKILISNEVVRDALVNNIKIYGVILARDSFQRHKLTKKNFLFYKEIWLCLMPQVLAKIFQYQLCDWP